MDKVKQLGKLIRKTNKETQHNTRRITENFPLPERHINVFNKLHPYKKEFHMDDSSVAKLNLQISPLTIPCTVNPPILDIRCAIKFTSDNPGDFTTPFSTTRSIVPGQDDFTWTSEGVTVPVDGCYSVLWTSPAWGVGYFFNKFVTVGLLHNGHQFRVVAQPTTGVISILGPGIYVYTPVSPLYAVVECKAGDIISAFMTQEDISQGYPWFGQVTGLHGFFVDTGSYAADIQIELVAVAEG